MADGTKFKGEGVNGKARQGDIKVVIGIHAAGVGFSNGNLDWYLLERGKPRLEKEEHPVT